MDLEMTGKKENKALQRQEVSFKAKEAKITPCRKELKPKIAALLNSKPELTVIKKISHPFGKREASIEAHVYDTEDALKKFGAGYLARRDQGKKGRESKKDKAKEAAKEKPAEEKPAKKGDE